MLPLVRLEGEQKSGAIYVYLFISETLKPGLLDPDFLPGLYQIDYDGTGQDQTAAGPKSPGD